LTSCSLQVNQQSLKKMLSLN